jgi:alkanesulfonate monooxygenase SsuD/methylene tetrahydromethanopterin reductase-like flavin-dependent oxidoreductase (luciferase family)
VIEHRGAHYDIPPLRLRPVPPSPVPIWIGGESAPALRRAARLGDGWISGRTPEQIEDAVSRLAEERQLAGRDGQPFDIAASLYAEPDATQLERASRLRIGHLKVQPWGWYGGDAARLETKLSALRRFADDHLGAAG